MAVLSQSEYRLVLQRMVAADTDPKLTADELNLLLKLNRIEDESGLAPTDLSWEPTYHLVRAALEGWRWKSAKASDLSVARTGDLTLEDNNIFLQCEKMIDHYRRLLNGAATIPVAGVTAGDTAIDEEA